MEFLNTKKEEADATIRCYNQPSMVNAIQVNEENTTEIQEKNSKKNKNDDGEKTSPFLTPVSWLTLFRFVEGWEVLILFVGFLTSLCNGLCAPFTVIFYGKLANIFITHGYQSNVENCVTNVNGCNNSGSTGEYIVTNSSINASSHLKDNQTDDAYREQLLMAFIGVAIILLIQSVMGYCMVACMNWTAERQTCRIRSIFFKAMLRQDIAWYDTHNIGEFASRTSNDLKKFQEGIGEKMAMCYFLQSSCIFNIVIAMSYGWQLTLVVASIIPLTMIAKFALEHFQSSFIVKETQAYAKAAEVSQEALMAVRTVTAYGGEEKEVARYAENLHSGAVVGVKLGITTALMSSLFNVHMYASLALAFWYGIKLIVEEANEENPSYTVYNFIITRITITVGLFDMMNSIPYVKMINQAKSAAAIIFEVIDRVPLIDSSSPEGLRLKTVVGNIEYDDVLFNYPSRPHVKVLEGLSLNVMAGETMALVGESGSGKSTIVQLIRRFYDPSYGAVKLDGNDIRTLNIGWLRQQMGIVEQEPTLFATTIGENIGYGLEDATQEDIENAAKMANAHDFIVKLPQKYKTIVGDRGIQLSGGQKQRVAIARALIKNPKILLLDEATSALDSESEACVQAALDKARLGRTTIIVAHRLSTIRNADKIAAIQGGKVVEIGTHAELMANGGIYHKLVTTQETNKNMDLLNEFEDVEINEQACESDVVCLADETNSRPSIENQHHNISIISKERIPFEEPELKPSLLKVLKYNGREWPFIMWGCVGIVGMSMVTAAFCIVFGDIMATLSYSNPEYIKAKGNFYTYVLLILAVFAAIASFLQVFGFSYASQYLTKRLRTLVFAAMLKQEMGWFDRPENSFGDLCSRLSADSAQVQEAIGSAIGTIGLAIITMATAVVLSLILSWQLALVGLCVVPVILLFTFFNDKITTRQAELEMDSLDAANSMAIDCITNIRTVASLHMETRFHAMYLEHLIEPHKAALRNVHSRGFVIGLTQPSFIFAYTSIIYYGSFLVESRGTGYATIFQISEILTIGAKIVGQAMAFAPNYTKGLLAAARIFLLLDRRPLIDTSQKNKLELSNSTPGKIHFKNVDFQYPSRPEVPVLQGLDLEIEPGQMVALVGSSGCGKTTCVQLIERFYEPTGGVVMMDGIDISQLNIGWLRSRVGIVSQEPMLFNRSIADNIRYGDNSREVGMAEVVRAAQNANIHNFITALPQGYETYAGDKGAHLSGGQKQRIAIARALVRNPKILLLDEATSALDTESEKVVQEALEQAQRGRTCITVAHRLSTIKNADQIAVVHQGKVVEIGTHDQLMAQRGHYQRFYQSAQLK